MKRFVLATAVGLSLTACVDSQPTKVGEITKIEDRHASCGGRIPMKRLTVRYDEYDRPDWYREFCVPFDEGRSYRVGNDYPGKPYR